jgi:hypothetical protein
MLHWRICSNEYKGVAWVTCQRTLHYRDSHIETGLNQFSLICSSSSRLESKNGASWHYISVGKVWDKEKQKVAEVENAGKTQGASRHSSYCVYWCIWLGAATRPIFQWLMLQLSSSQCIIHISMILYFKGIFQHCTCVQLFEGNCAQGKSHFLGLFYECHEYMI